LAANVPVGSHLADQLLLPLALAGSGSFRTQTPTQHTTTNVNVIQKFLPVHFALHNTDRDSCLVELEH
jgi:RNA 3'-terminal phosphate cyclase (ATP)